MREQEMIVTNDGSMAIGVKIRPRYLITVEGDLYRWNKTRGWSEVKQTTLPTGYHEASMDGRSQYIHRIVAEAYMDNPRGCREVDHIDGDKSNNRADNLRWCTHSENVKAAYDIGLMRWKEHSTKRSLTEEEVKAIRADEEHNLQELARRYKVSVSTIWNVIHGVTYAQ